MMHPLKVNVAYTGGDNIYIINGVVKGNLLFSLSYFHHLILTQKGIFKIH